MPAPPAMYAAVLAARLSALTGDRGCPWPGARHAAARRRRHVSHGHRGCGGRFACPACGRPLTIRATGTDEGAHDGRRDQSQPLPVASLGGAPKQQPDVSTPARSAAVAIENRIRNEPLETGALISRSGRLLAQNTGTTDRVSFTNAELLVASGATFTHNHPSGTGPSVSDVALGIEFAFEEVRVVTADYRFGVSGLRGVQVQAVEAAYAAEELRVQRLLHDEVRRNLLHPKDYGQELVHRTWERVKTALKFTYWRQPS